MLLTKTILTVRAIIYFARRSAQRVGGTKTLRVMQLTAILFLGLCLHLSAAGISQRVTYSGKNIPLQNIITAVKGQTGIVFFYSTKEVKKANLVSLDAKNLPLQEFLELVFKNQTLDFSIKGNAVFIREKKIFTVGGLKYPASSFFTPPIDVKGRIVNEKGEPVVASVIIKGTTRGTTSDANGNFSLDNVDNNAVLVISATNIETITYKVDGQSNINISAKTSTSSLDEVVINKGYYTESKRLSTANVSTVTSKDIEKQPISNPLQAIQGRMAGVYVQQQTGVAGGGFSIQIRGRNSISPARNNPLYIIDGVPFTATSLSYSSISIPITQGGSPLNSINPSEIESIEILKDADATSIYGSRGANGVVLITTKKGKPGKAKVGLNYYQGFGKVSNTLDVLDTKQYLEMRNEAFENDGVIPTITNAYDLLKWDTTKNTDWQKKLLGGTANITNAQATISGGNASTQYLIGGGFYRETTVFANDYSNTRLSGLINLNHISVNKRFKILLSANFSVTDNTLPQVDFTSTAITLAPNAPGGFDQNGEIDWSNGTFNNNPFAIFTKQYNSTTNNLIVNIIPSFEIYKGLIIKANIGYNRMSIKEEQFNPLKSYPPDWGLISGISNFGENGIRSWNFEPQLDYSRKIKLSSIEVQLGTTLQQNLSEGLWLRATGFSSDAMIQNISAASSVSVQSNNYAKYRFQSLFGRIGYAYNNKYILNLTGRRDGSSRFGPDRKYAIFGALGAAWVFSETNFIKNSIPLLNYAKLRMSYGSTGSDQIGDYGYLNSYSPTFYPYHNQSALYPSYLSNAEFGWEDTRKFELGIDANFFNDRIVSKFSWYRNVSSSQLAGYPLAPTTGFSTILANIPAKVENKGFEIEITSTNFKTAKFSWTTSFNMTIPRNKLLDYPDLASSTNRVSYEIGAPLAIARRYSNLGVDNQTGLYKFEDINNNGLIDNPGDLIGLKAVTQEFYGGFNNQISFNRFQVDIFIQFVKQTGYNFMNGSVFGPPGTISNQPTDVLSRWQLEAQIGNNQKFSQSSVAAAAYRRNRFSDNSISDASFARVRNISVSYEFAQKWNKKLSIQNSRVYIQGQNLWTSTSYKGLDPETQSNEVLPILSVLSVGIQLSF
jgi:TonB-linked SusC/RagA family outer membrane protein